MRDPEHPDDEVTQRLLDLWDGATNIFLVSWEGHACLGGHLVRAGYRFGTSLWVNVHDNQPGQRQIILDCFRHNFPEAKAVGFNDTHMVIETTGIYLDSLEAIVHGSRGGLFNHKCPCGSHDKVLTP